MQVLEVKSHLMVDYSESKSSECHFRCRQLVFKVVCQMNCDLAISGFASDRATKASPLFLHTQHLPKNPKQVGELHS